jgi:6-pyruvoyltetrahydropterin/6-carboxytetrahydropterin synthase
MSHSALEEYLGESDLAKAGERTLIVGEDNPIRISTGHRILPHEGKCSRPHGHNYEISVEVTGTLTEEGWVVDKGDITGIIDDWDHKFLVEDGDPLIEAFEVSGDGESLVVFDHPPTAEVMAVMLEDRMLDELPDTVSDVSVTVRETGELCVS